MHGYVTDFFLVQKVCGRLSGIRFARVGRSRNLVDDFISEITASGFVVIRRKTLNNIGKSM